MLNYYTYALYGSAGFRKTLIKKMLIYKEISEFLFKLAKLSLSAVSISGKFAFVEQQQEYCI